MPLSVTLMVFSLKNKWNRCLPACRRRCSIAMRYLVKGIYYSNFTNLKATIVQYSLTMLNNKQCLLLITTVKMVIGVFCAEFNMLGVAKSPSSN